MKIDRLSAADAERVRTIALKTWPNTFGEILSPEQIAYMLRMMYDVPVLQSQLESGHEFFMLTDRERDLGFIGLQRDYPERGKYKIHKLYVLPAAQGGGFGKKLLEKARETAEKAGIRTLNLNVNRLNAPAIHFYKRQDFEIVKAEDIDIGNGFLMEDYQMELTW